MSYPTLLEKLQIVDEDFKKSALYQLGEIPDEKEAADDYFKKAVDYAGEFLKRWKVDKEQNPYEAFKNDLSKLYVRVMVSDYLESLERNYKKKHPV